MTLGFKQDVHETTHTQLNSAIGFCVRVRVCVSNLASSYTYIFFDIFGLHRFVRVVRRIESAEQQPRKQNTQDPSH